MRIRQLGTLNEALAGLKIHDSEVRVEYVTCPHCHCENRVTIFPFSPQIAKVICRSKGDRGCGRVFEARTRQSVWDDIDEHVDVQKDKKHVAKRSSVNVRAERVQRELAAIAEAKAGAVPGAKVLTKFGPAYIIGKRQRA